MDRYHVFEYMRGEAHMGEYNITKDINGEWVKWVDVKDLIDQLTLPLGARVAKHMARRKKKKNKKIKNKE